jgi:hypothetical protein
MLTRRWPKAFSRRASLVRPLNGSVHRTLVAELGWHTHYARGVLHVWKSRKAYCVAVLAHEYRIHIDGAVSEVRVEELDRNSPRTRLLEIEERERRQHEAAASWWCSIQTGKRHRGRTCPTVTSRSDGRSEASRR